MIERELEIVNRLGLHARAAAKLVHAVGGFKSRVTLIRDGEEADAKSILGILLMAAPQGTKIWVRADGQDEQEAMTAVATLIEDRFGEES
jgi:phosphocarrier protein HPr